MCLAGMLGDFSFQHLKLKYSRPLTEIDKEKKN